MVRIQRPPAGLTIGFAPRTTPPLAHELGDCFHEATTAASEDHRPVPADQWKQDATRIGGGPANRQMRVRWNR